MQDLEGFKGGIYLGSVISIDREGTAILGHLSDCIDYDRPIWWPDRDRKYMEVTKTNVEIWEDFRKWMQERNAKGTNHENV